MIISDLKKPDPKTMTFEQIFKVYDDNFDKMRDAFDREGDKIYEEQPKKVGSNVVEFERAFSYGKSQLMVFYNGAVQFTPEDYIQLDNNRIKFNFDICDEDEIHGLIIEVSQEADNTASLYREMQTYYENMKKTLESSKSELDELYSNMKDLETRLIQYEQRATTQTAVDIDIAKRGFSNYYDRSNKMALMYTTLEEIRADKSISDSDLVLLLGENKVGDIGKGVYRVLAYTIESDIPGSYYNLNRDNLYLVRIVSL